MTPPASPNIRPSERGDTLVTAVAVWRNARKHWATVLATALVVSLGVTFYTLGQKKIYQATATVLFDPHPPKPLGKSVDTVVELGNGNYWNNREYFETQYKVVQSMRVAMAVVRELDLNHDPAFIEEAVPGAKPAPRETSVDEAAEILRARLRVDPVKESRLAVVSYEDADAQRAARILSSLVDAYVEENMEDALASTNAAVDWLRGQLDKLKTDLESSEMALHEYKLQKNILSVAFSDQSNMLQEEMKQINASLTAVRTRREEVSARKAVLTTIDASDPSVLPANELLQSPLLQILRQRHEEAIRDRAALLGAGKGERHPEVVAATERITTARAALLSEVKNIQGALGRELDAITRQEGGLSGMFERAKTQALDLNLLEIEYNRLLRSKDNTEKLYSMLLERTKESDLTRMLRVNNIRIIDRPLVPRKPIRPRVAVNVVFGVLFGLGLGLAAAMSRALLDRTVKNPDDIEQELGANFLGLLPIIDKAQQNRYGRKRKRGKEQSAVVVRELAVHEHPMSGFAESARAVRTNIMFTAPDKPYKRLLVTSAGPSEGKTTVACCLAVAMAQAGQRVALVDCDLRRPRIHRIFKKTAEVGVTTALLDETKLTATFLETEVPNLWIIPSGPLPPNPAELFHSARFKKLLDDISEHFDRVIIDTPPIVPVTDATVLSTLVDGCVLVVRAFGTLKDVAYQSLRALSDVGGKTAGVVLNAVDLDRSEYNYYRYYRRDGYYSSDSDSESKSDEKPTAAAAE